MRKLNIFNAYKIHDLEPERHVQSWFLVLLIAYSALMMGLSGLDLQTQLLTQAIVWLLNPTAPLLEFDHRFYIYAIAYPLVLLAGFLLSTTYASTLIYNANHKESKSALPQVARRFFPLLIYALLIGGIHLLSIFLLEIPYFFFLSIFYYVPVEVVLEKRSLTEAMEQSYRQTKGRKLHIFASIIAVTFLIRFLSQFLVSTMAGSAWAGSLIMGFAFALRMLASGRLKGILYLTQKGIELPRSGKDDL